MMNTNEMYLHLVDDSYQQQDNSEQVLVESIKKLQAINKKIAKATLEKEELTSTIISALGHKHEGQKTYEYSVWNIEVKTPVVYSLDKKMYESMDIGLLKDFNPVKESISYSLDKKACEDYINNAPSDIKALLVDLITKKAGKESVTIKDRK